MVCRVSAAGMKAHRVCMIKKHPDVLLKNVAAYFQLLGLEETLLDRSAPSVPCSWPPWTESSLPALPDWYNTLFGLSTRHFPQSRSLFTQTKFPGSFWQSPSKDYSISCMAFIMLCNLNPLLKKALSVALDTSWCGIQGQMHHAFHARWQGSSIFPSTSALKFLIFSGSIQEKNDIKLNQTIPCFYFFLQKLVSFWYTP